MVVPSELLLMVFAVWVLWCHCLVPVQGHGGCSRQQHGYSNITTDLQSDVLLPCSFRPGLLKSHQTAEIAAVWTHINIKDDHLVEITLDGEEKFWNNRGGRIQAFPKLSTSGNFSILLRKVNKSDLGLYRCELFNETGCRIAHLEIQLGLSTRSTDSYQTSIIAGTSGGAVLILLVILVFYIASKRRARDSPVYEYCTYPVRDNQIQEGPPPDRPICTLYDRVQHSQSREGKTRDTPIYENFANPGQQSQGSEGHTYDRPIYTQYVTVHHSQSRDEEVYENPIYTRGKVLDKPRTSQEEMTCDGTSVPETPE